GFVGSKRCDHQVGFDREPRLPCSGAIASEEPDVAAAPVAVEVGSGSVGRDAAAVDLTAGYRAALIMTIGGHRQREAIRITGPVRRPAREPFHLRPAEVVT